MNTIKHKKPYFFIITRVKVKYLSSLLQGWLILASLIIYSSGCDSSTSQIDIINEKYIHLAHTRLNDNSAVDPRIENIDLTKFDMIWLGGDLMYNTSSDDSTMTYIDSIFNVGSQSTLWAPGNHDYSNPSLISSYTNRETYYTFHKNNITYLVMDTQKNQSRIIGDQYELVKEVTDTITNSSHLIILTHKLIWMRGNNELKPIADSISNGPLGDCSYCINSNNFYDDIYPLLINVKQRGIEVVCIAGDIGKKVSEFEYLTDEGIYFLASGISTDKTNNKILLFEYDLGNRQLEWEYADIN